MALYKSPIFSSVSGSIKGITFSKNRGGQYVKGRSSPTNPNTTQQQTIRTILSDLSNLWVNTLSQADRNKWADYAANVPVTNRLGDSINLSGINMYVRCNSPRIQAGFARVDTAPVIFDLGSFTPVTIEATAAADGISVTFENTDDWANEDGGGMFIYAARPQNETINYFKGPYQFAGSIDGAAITPPAVPGGATSPFAFEIGQKIFTRIQTVRADGRLSADSRDGVIAVA
jgi:hypothetical protein